MQHLKFAPQSQIPHISDPNKVIKFSQFQTKKLYPHQIFATHTTTFTKKKNVPNKKYPHQIFATHTVAKKKLYTITTYQPKIQPNKKGKFSAIEKKMSDFEIHRPMRHIYGGDGERERVIHWTRHGGHGERDLSLCLWVRRAQ